MRVPQVPNQLVGATCHFKYLALGMMEVHLKCSWPRGIPWKPAPFALKNISELSLAQSTDSHGFYLCRLAIHLISHSAQQACPSNIRMKTDLFHPPLHKTGSADVGIGNGGGRCLLWRI